MLDKSKLVVGAKFRIRDNNGDVLYSIIGSHNPSKDWTEFWAKSLSEEYGLWTYSTMSEHFLVLLDFAGRFEHVD